MITNRGDFFSRLIGVPWVANAKGPDAYDCYHLVRHVQKELFNREMLDIEVPNEVTWRYVMGQIQNSSEREKWGWSKESTGPDGSIVVMAKNVRAAHLGVWLAPERGVIHTDKPLGVQFHQLPELRALGWNNLKFLEYVGDR